MSKRFTPSPKVLKPEVHKLSDRASLFWERFYGPMQSAAQAMNSAITNTQNILAGIVIEMEGYSSDTHLLDLDRMVIVKRPQPPAAVTGDNGK